MVKLIFAAPEELELVTEGQATAIATATETSSFINAATDLLLEVKDEEISLLKKRLAEFEATTKMEKEKEKVEKIVEKAGKEVWREVVEREVVEKEVEVVEKEGNEGQEMEKERENENEGEDEENEKEKGKEKVDGNDEEAD